MHFTCIIYDDDSIYIFMPKPEQKKYTVHFEGRKNTGTKTRHGNDWCWYVLGPVCTCQVCWWVSHYLPWDLRSCIESLCISVICPLHCLETPWAVPCVCIWLTCGLWGWAGLAAGLWSSLPIRRCSRETTIEWRASTTCRPSLMPRTAATTPAQAAQSRWTGRHKEQAADPHPRSVIIQTCK